MCDFCKELIKCPVGEKRQVELFGNGEGVDTDAYGHDLITAPLTMYIDKNNKDGWSCGIYQDVYTEDSVHYGIIQ